MKILILSPNIQNMLTTHLERILRRTGKVLIYSEIRPLTEIPELFDDDEKVIAVDPDYCNWCFPDTVITKLRHTVAICLQTTSYSWINTTLTSSHGIPVMNIRHWSTQAVAEWAILMMVSLARRIPLVAKADWSEDYDVFKGIELAGKTAGIIGLGHNGRRIAEMCLGMGMAVQYWSKHSRDRRFSYHPLQKIIATSDVIFPTLAKNPETVGLLRDEVIKTVKRSAIVVNTVDGLCNHRLLVRMAEEGKIFGYGFEESGGKVFGSYRGNIWAGPALAWVTNEAWERNVMLWVDTIVNAASHLFPNRVN